MYVNVVSHCISMFLCSCWGAILWDHARKTGQYENWQSTAGRLDLGMKSSQVVKLGQIQLRRSLDIRRFGNDSEWLQVKNILGLGI